MHSRYRRERSPLDPPWQPWLAVRMDDNRRWPIAECRLPVIGRRYALQRSDALERGGVPAALLIELVAAAEKDHRRFLRA